MQNIIAWGILCENTIYGIPKYSSVQKQIFHTSEAQ